MNAASPRPRTDPSFWDKIAQKYSQKPVDDPEAFERKIAITKRLLRPDSRVLDVGCGTGSLALILGPDAGEVHGLDFSPEMVRIATSKRDAQGADNVHFHCGTIHETEAFEPDSLDVLMAFSLLHLVPDRAATLARFRELLVPGGHFVSSTVCLKGGLVPYSLLLGVMKLFGQAPPVWVVGHEQMVAEFEAAGFVDVQVHDVGSKNGQVLFVTATNPA